MLRNLAVGPCAIVKEGGRSGMRTLGLLGGMSWESTAEYYRLINRGIAERLGGLHSARLLMHSVDFADVAALQCTGDWRAAARSAGGVVQSRRPRRLNHRGHGGHGELQSVRRFSVT